jgi:anti-sigma factor RsiW
VLKCHDISELATDYAEGVLPPGRRFAMRFHLAFCRMCRAYIDQLEKTRRLLAGQALEGPPAEVEDRLVATLRPTPGD